MDKRNVRCSLFVAMGIVLVLCAGRGSGWAEEIPEVTTPEVVTTATKTPVPVTHLTSAVEVIRGEDIERRKIKTVIDALRLAQGMTVFSSGGPGTLAQVQMRGTKSAHTMVMMDGVILNSPTSGLFNFADLMTDNIERIEILRGPQGMLYGSDAIGGVISITTKRGAGKPTANAFLEYGSFASLREGAQIAGAHGPVDFTVALSRWDTSSFSAANYKRGAFERDGFRNWQASGRVGVALPRDGRLEVNLRWWNSDVSFDNTNADVYGSSSINRNLILSGMYEQSWTPWWSQKLTLAQANEQAISHGGPVQKNLTTGVTGPAFTFSSNFETLNQRLEWQHNFQVAKPLLLTAGYQFRQEQGDSSSAFGAAQPNRLLTSNAGFAQAQVNIDNRIFATAGLRQDHYNVFGDATTYRVTAGYLFKDSGTKVRGSYGTGFKAPTLNDLFFQDVANATLKPEKSQGLDVGVDQYLLQDRLQINATYFWNRFRNLIQFVTSPTCPPATAPFGVCAENVALATSQGWEFAFRYAVRKDLDVHAQYTYTLTRSYATPMTPGNTNKRLARWPVDQASVGISYQPIEPLRLNLDYRFVGERDNDAANSPSERMGSFGVVNLAGTYEVTKHMQAFGRIENLFNQDYEESRTFGTPIRSVYGGVKLTY